LTTLFVKHAALWQYHQHTQLICGICPQTQNTDQMHIINSSGCGKEYKTSHSYCGNHCIITYSVSLSFYDDAWPIWFTITSLFYQYKKGFMSQYVGISYFNKWTICVEWTCIDQISFIYLPCESAVNIAHKAISKMSVL
jgi:hypothetical protein